MRLSHERFVSLSPDEMSLMGRALASGGNAGIPFGLPLPVPVGLRPSPAEAHGARGRACGTRSSGVLCEGGAVESRPRSHPGAWPRGLPGHWVRVQATVSAQPHGVGPACAGPRWRGEGALAPTGLDAHSALLPLLHTARLTRRVPSTGFFRGSPASGLHLPRPRTKLRGHPHALSCLQACGICDSEARRTLLSSGLCCVISSIK